LTDYHESGDEVEISDGAAAKHKSDFKQVNLWAVFHHFHQSILEKSKSFDLVHFSYPLFSRIWSEYQH
jgi:hypothetical protein